MPKHKRQRRRNRLTVVDAAGGGGGARQTKPRRPFSFYILATADLRCTYGGVTTNFARRIQQHNGIIGNDKKGAKHTRMLRAQGHGLLQPVLVVTGFSAERSAHSLESWFHDQRRPIPEWNDHIKMTVRPQELDIVDDSGAVTKPIRQSIALLRTLLTERPGGRFSGWPLQFQFHLKAAEPRNFSAVFPASCTLFTSPV